MASPEIVREDEPRAEEEDEERGEPDPQPPAADPPVASGPEVAPNVQAVTTFHLPEFTLKVDTHDLWSTHSALKKKACVLPDGRTLRLEDLPGARRFGKNPSKAHLFIYFDSAEARAAAVPLLQQRCTKGQAWSCTACPPAEAHRALGIDRRPRAAQKRGVEAVDGAQEGASQAPPLKRLKTVEEAVTGYAHLPYPEQLQRKHQHFLRTLKAMTVTALKPWLALRRQAPDTALPSWLQEATRNRQDLCCEPSPVVPCPEAAREGYRNKSSFTCGYDAAGRDTVGFLLGLYTEGHVAVGQPYGTKHLSDLTKHYCAVFQALIDERRAEGLRCYDKCTHQGFWRLLTVRETVHRDVLLVVQYRPPEGWTPEARAEFRTALVRHFTTAPPTEYLCRDRPHALKAVFGQEYADISNAAPPTVPCELLYGEPFLLETCRGLRFRIRPQSFFQINTLANERLLEIILELGAIDHETLVLDLCCGTGNIGLSLAGYCARVIGIDNVEDAIADARDNCGLNGIGNASFLCDKIESPSATWHLSEAVRQFPPGKAVAICDPPRGGLHAKFLQWLRNTPAIQRVVYVSCDQNSLIRDTLQLAKPQSNAYTGLPFQPAAARALDLFPHTDHCEAVVAWIRPPEGPEPAPTPAEPTDSGTPLGTSDSPPG